MTGSLGTCNIHFAQVGMSNRSYESWHTRPYTLKRAFLVWANGCVARHLFGVPMCIVAGSRLLHCISVLRMSVREDLHYVPFLLQGATMMRVCLHIDIRVSCPIVGVA